MGVFAIDIIYEKKELAIKDKTTLKGRIKWPIKIGKFPGNWNRNASA